MLMWVAVWVKEADCPSLGMSDALVVSLAQTVPIHNSKVSQRPPCSALEERHRLKPLFNVQHLDFLLTEVLQHLGSTYSVEFAVGRSADSTFSKFEESRTSQWLGVPPCLGEILEMLLQTLPVLLLHRSTVGQGDVVRTAHFALADRVPGAADLELDVGVAVPEDVAGEALGLADALVIDFLGAV
jgi:hypothetical protein